MVIGKSLPDELHNAGFIIDVNWLQRIELVVDSGS